jgi:hypothetical protein
MNVLTQRSHADLFQRRMDEYNQGYRHRKEVVVTSRGISACGLAMATSTVAFSELDSVSWTATQLWDYNTDDSPI